MRAFILAALNIFISIVITLAFFEAILRVNPSLMLKGTALNAPIDPPLTTQVYDFRYSDSDVYIWHPDLVQPISPENDLIEAHVEYSTDEFGFRNVPPLPIDIDIVVLGRSISQAAHLPYPWPNMFEERTGLHVLNLAQIGSGINIKMDYLKQFGLIRNPKWVIIEVIPILDIHDGEGPPFLLSQRLLIPFIRSLLILFHYEPQRNISSNEIYPLQVDIGNRTVPLTCCTHFMEFYTVDQKSIKKSHLWFVYEKKLQEIIDYARNNSICVALLYAPTKPEVYFPLANNPSQLRPSIKEISTINVNYEGSLIYDKTKNPDVEIIINNSFAGRDVIKEFALSIQVPFIDPTDAMKKAVLDGNDPFMKYDSHWNTLGHEIVTSEVIETLQNARCP